MINNMAEIRFKAKKTKHSSGFADIHKSGALAYDQDRHSSDGIWLYPKKGERIFIDCDFKTKEFILHFNADDFELDKTYANKNPLP